MGRAVDLLAFPLPQFGRAGGCQAVRRVRHIVGRLYVPYSCQPQECAAIIAVRPFSYMGDALVGGP